jgi:hypothetical protein
VPAPVRPDGERFCGASDRPAGFPAGG